MTRVNIERSDDEVTFRVTGTQAEVADVLGWDPVEGWDLENNDSVSYDVSPQVKEPKALKTSMKNDV